MSTMPKPSAQYLNRLKKIVGKEEKKIEVMVENAAEDCQSKCHTCFERCCGSKFVSKCKTTILDFISHKAHHKEKFMPVFPFGIFICTLLTLAATAAILLGWAHVQEIMDDWEGKMEVVVNQFYASAAESKVEVGEVISVQMLHTARVQTTSTMMDIVLGSCATLIMIGVLMSLHSVAIHCAFKSKAVDDIFDLACIASHSVRAVIHEIYVDLLHLLSISAVVLAAILFAIIAATALVVQQPDRMCNHMRPLEPSMKLLPELLAGVDDVLAKLSHSGVPTVGSELGEMGVSLFGHVGLETPCNSTKLARNVVMETSRRCAEVMQLATFTVALGADSPHLEIVPRVQRLCFASISMMTSLEALCDGSSHDYDVAPDYIKQRLHHSADALGAATLALAHSSPKSERYLDKTTLLVNSSLARIDKDELSLHAQQLGILMRMVHNSSLSLNEASSRVCSVAQSIGSEAGAVMKATLVILLCAVGLRVFVLRDIFYLFNYVLGEKALLEGIPWPTVYTGIIALLASTALLVATVWSGAALHNEASSLHLPPSIDKPVVESISQTYVSLTTFAFVVSALSLGALCGTLLRGMYIAPSCANTDYKKDAAAELAAGKWCAFQTKKFLRSLCYDVTSVLALVGVLLLLLVASINYGVLVKADSACYGIEEAIFTGAYPALHLNTTSLLLSSTPFLHGAKYVAGVVLGSVPLAALSMDQAFIQSVMSVDLSSFCSASSSFFTLGGQEERWQLPIKCSEVLPALSMFLSDNPLTSSVIQNQYYAKIAPVCSEFETSFRSLESFCASGEPTLGNAPDFIKDEVVGSFTSWFRTIDDALRFIFDNRNLQALARFVFTLDEKRLRRWADALDNIDYPSFYSQSCGVASTLSTLSLVILASSAVLALCVLFGWNQLHRYTMLSNILDHHVQDEKGEAAHNGAAEKGWLNKAKELL